MLKFLKQRLEIARPIGVMREAVQLSDFWGLNNGDNVTTQADSPQSAFFLPYFCLDQRKSATFEPADRGDTCG
jgi:hypothetical protein